MLRLNQRDSPGRGTTADLNCRWKRWRERSRRVHVCAAPRSPVKNSVRVATCCANGIKWCFCSSRALPSQLAATDIVDSSEYLAKHIFFHFFKGAEKGVFFLPSHGRGDVWVKCGSPWQAAHPCGCAGASPASFLPTSGLTLRGFPGEFQPGTRGNSSATDEVAAAWPLASAERGCRLLHLRSKYLSWRTGAAPTRKGHIPRKSEAHWEFVSSQKKKKKISTWKHLGYQGEATNAAQR